MEWYNNGKANESFIRNQFDPALSHQSDQRSPRKPMRASRQSERQQQSGSGQPEEQQRSEAEKMRQSTDVSRDNNNEDDDDDVVEVTEKAVSAKESADVAVQQDVGNQHANSDDEESGRMDENTCYELS